MPPATKTWWASTPAVAADVTGNGHTGVLVNGPGWTGDPALDFDGVDDYVDVGALDVSGGAITMSAASIPRRSAAS